GLANRCGGFCRKCDFRIQDRFDSFAPVTQATIIAAVLSALNQKMENPRAVVGVIALLSRSQFQEFFPAFPPLPPFDSAFAWRVIDLATSIEKRWFIERARAPFQREFHLHPILAPCLINSAIQSAKGPAEMITLYEHFKTVAAAHSTLDRAKPLWEDELNRR